MAVENALTGCNVAREPHIGTDDRTFADDHTPQDGGIGIDDDTVFEYGMSQVVLDGITVFVERKTFGPQSHAVIALYVIADDASGTDADARAMVDGEMTADLCGGMYVYPRFAVSHFCDDARNERHA